VVRYVSDPTPGSAADLQDDADPEQVARMIVLRRLSAASRTRFELADDLRRRGVPDDVAERVLDRFVEVGLIDDGQFARMWADSRQRTRGTARAVLRQELRRRGVGDDDIVEALSGIDDGDERARACELVTVKVRAMSRLDPQTRERRLIAMLMRRGYRQHVAIGVVRDVLGEAADVDNGEDDGSPDEA
jgi:regulatory protein